MGTFERHTKGRKIKKVKEETLSCYEREREKRKRKRERGGQRTGKEEREGDTERREIVRIKSTVNRERKIARVKE